MQQFYHFKIFFTYENMKESLHLFSLIWSVNNVPTYIYHVYIKLCSFTEYSISRARIHIKWNSRYHFTAIRHWHKSRCLFVIRKIRDNAGALSLRQVKIFTVAFKCSEPTLRDNIYLHRYIHVWSIRRNARAPWNAPIRMHSTHMSLCVICWLHLVSRHPRINLNFKSTLKKRSESVDANRYSSISHRTSDKPSGSPQQCAITCMVKLASLRKSLDQSTSFVQYIFYRYIIIIN